MEIKILMMLMKKYYDSKTFKGENVVNQSFAITPRQVNSSYGDNFKVQETERVDDTCSKLAAMKFVTLEKNKNGATISIKLNKDKIKEIEDYLKNVPGFISKGEIVNELRKLINDTNPCNQYVEAYLSEVNDKINKNAKTLPSATEVDDMIQILSHLTSIKDEIYIREFSQFVLGKTKAFEENYQSKTCTFLLSNFDFVIDDEEKKEKVLENFNILINPGYVYLKGNIEVVINGHCLNLSSLQGFALCDKDFNHISSIRINDERLITIENITSFNRFSEPGYSCIYLGGYHNECRRNLLKLIYKENPLISYYHCGDIDAGGLYILEHLKEKTDVPFQPYKMDVPTLSDKRYEKALISLTKSDISRLNVLSDSGVHKDLIAYMLQNNCKLEQEIVTMLDSKKNN